MCEFPERGVVKQGNQIAWTEHYTRLIRLVDSHPQISMDFTGLTDVMDYTFLNEYDFVYLYLHPVEGGHPNIIWWYDLPEIIKPYCKKLIVQFDYEGIMTELPPFLQNILNTYADALCYNSPATKNWNLTIPKYPFMIANPVEKIGTKVKELASQKPPVKSDTIGVLWHAGTGCNITRSLQLCSSLPWNTKIFTSWIGMSTEFMQKHFGQPSNWSYYPFMEYNEYLKELLTCWVALEDNENYYGFSRFAYECAALHIPVVGSTNNMACNIAYPYTTTNPENLQLQGQLIKRLFDDPDFYSKVVDYAYNKMMEYMSDEACLKRFVQILEDLKVLT